MNNIQWLFSGIGVVVLGFLIKLFFFKPDNKKRKDTKKITVNINNPISNLKSEVSDNTIISKKRFINILFIDDDTEFKIIEILNSIGWNTRIISDVLNLDSQQIIDTHLFFVDINGVGLKLGFKDEGLGLAKAIKRKYPSKKVVIYSSDENGNRFHDALRIVDDFLNKNAETIEFTGIIENLVKDIKR